MAVSNTPDALDAYRTGKYMGAVIAVDLLRELFPNTIDGEAEDFVFSELERNINR